MNRIIYNIIMCGSFGVAALASGVVSTIAMCVFVAGIVWGIWMDNKHPKQTAEELYYDEKYPSR